MPAYVPAGKSFRRHTPAERPSVRELPGCIAVVGINVISLS